MDRDLLLKCLNSDDFTQGKLLLKDYCKEIKNMADEDCDSFINLILENQILYSRALITAIVYYKAKFNIIEIKDKNSNTLLIY